ncbi:protein kinase domain-containing protein, partial [Streptomyces griseoluteus]
PDGTVKVLDFGVAKFLGDTLGARQLTVTGVPLGSPPYMSPEQAEGVRDIDHRSDLYSLGCLLYHAVTGRPPFVSHVQLAVLRMQMEDAPVPPSQLVPGLPSALDDLILHLLAKRPDDRPADAVAVHDVLTGILVQQAVSRSDVTVLDMARVRAADAVAGQLVKKAWEVWQQVEAVEVQIEETEAWAARVRTDAEAEIRRRLDEAAAAAEHTVAAARVEAERMVAAARSEASKILSEAKDTALQAESLRLDMWNDVHWPRQVMEALVPALLVTDDEKRAVTGYAFPAFAQVRRGYDRKQVEERIRQLLAERDDYQAELRSLARAYVTRKVTSGTTAGSSALEYEAVRRRAQQELIEALDTDLRYTDYEPRSAYASMGDGLPPFELVRKGYDRAQVDRYIEKLWQEEVYLYAGITVLRRLL